MHWTPRSVRGPTFSPSFISGILSVSFACLGRSGAPKSVSGPGMPFFKQFMGQEVVEFLQSVLGVEGEWRRLKLGLTPAHL